MSEPVFTAAWPAWRRRGVAALVGVALTLAAVGLARLVTPVEYRASAVMMLKLQEGRENPFLQLGALMPARDAFVSSLDSAAVGRLLAPGDGVSYRIIGDGVDAAPLIRFTAASPDARSARETRDRFVELVPGRLRVLQRAASTPRAAQIDVMELSAASTLTTLDAGRSRMMILVALGGAVATAILVGMAGRRLPLRQRSR